MYKLILIRKNNGIGNKSIEDITETITEYKRQKVEINETESENDSEHSTESEISNDIGSNNGYQYIHRIIPNRIEITINKMDCIPFDIDERFNLYLNKFNSDIPSIKSLPYYLIPLVSSLRYYLNEKKRLKQYITTSSNDQKIKLTCSVNEIFDYEFEALVASSIAALTLTFLNIKSFKSNNHNLSKIYNSLDENINDNSNHNIDFLLNKQRLELKDNEKLNKNKILNYVKNESSNIQLKRNTQILAEFRNVLTINSNIMQILKLTDDHQEFQWLSTMHHYVYEEAYHAIIFQIKDDNKPRINNIKNLFKNLFFINGLKNDNENFISYIFYLDKIYRLICLNLFLHHQSE